MGARVCLCARSRPYIVLDEKFMLGRFFFFFQDTRFNHDIDARTGYKTHSLLCMPIKDFNGEVMGVAQVSYGANSRATAYARDEVAQGS